MQKFFQPTVMLRPCPSYLGAFHRISSFPMDWAFLVSGCPAAPEKMMGLLGPSSKGSNIQNHQETLLVRTFSGMETWYEKMATKNILGLTLLVEEENDADVTKWNIDDTVCCLLRWYQTSVHIFFSIWKKNKIFDIHTCSIQRSSTSINLRWLQTRVAFLWRSSWVQIWGLALSKSHWFQVLKICYSKSHGLSMFIIFQTAKQTYWSIPHWTKIDKLDWYNHNYPCWKIHTMMKCTITTFPYIVGLPDIPVYSNMILICISCFHYATSLTLCHPLNTAWLRTGF